MHSFTKAEQEKWGQLLDSTKQNHMTDLKVIGSSVILMKIELKNELYYFRLNRTSLMKCWKTARSNMNLNLL
jgi:hypothetical protein